MNRQVVKSKMHTPDRPDDMNELQEKERIMNATREPSLPDAAPQALRGLKEEIPAAGGNRSMKQMPDAMPQLQPINECREHDPAHDDTGCAHSTGGPDASPPIKRLSVRFAPTFPLEIEIRQSANKQNKING